MVSIFEVEWYKCYKLFTRKACCTSAVGSNKGCGAGCSFRPQGMLYINAAEVYCSSSIAIVTGGQIMW